MEKCPYSAFSWFHYLEKLEEASERWRKFPPLLWPWLLLLADQTDNVEDLKKENLFELETSQPNGLNEREVDPFLYSFSSFFIILIYNIYCNKWQWHVDLYFYLKDFTLFIDLISFCFIYCLSCNFFFFEYGFFIVVVIIIIYLVLL